MRHSGYFVDANLLVLLVVGNVDRDDILKHKRTRAYTVSDYEKLSQMLASVKRILVTPNTLTETSNLVCGDERMAAMLRKLIQSSHIEEVYIDSRTATGRGEFEWLGLTDCGLLELITPETPLLSADFALIRTALVSNSRSVVHFPLDDP